MAESNEEVIGMVVKLAAESTDFQNQMTTLNRQMKVLQSDYKATASSSKDFESTMEGIAAKSEYLNNALKTQQSIVDAHSSRLEKSKQRLSDLAETQVKLKSRIDTLTSAYDAFSDAEQEGSEEAQKIKEELEQLQAQYSKNNDKINTTTKTIDNQTISYNNARATMNNLESQLKETTDSMEKLGTEAKQADAAVNNMNGTGNPFDQFTGGVKEAVGQTKIFGVSLSDIGGALTGTISPANLMTGAMAGITSALTDLIIQGIQRSIEALGQLVISMVSTGNEFSSQISRLQALTMSTNSAAQGFEDLARQLGADTVYSASEAAKAMEYAALAGWKLEDMTNGMPGILNLAAASGEELATVSDILTDDLTALGYGTEYATQMADVFAATMSNSNTNVEMFGEAMSYAGATAGALGYSMEDVSVAIGLMANSGVKGSSAGTALRKIMVQLASGVTLSSKAMGEFTISSSNSDGTIKPLKQTISELRNAFSNMTEEEKAANAEAIGGKTAMTGLLTIVNAAEKDYNQLSTAIENSAGASSKMAETMIHNVSGQIDMFMSKVESIGLSIYSMIEPIILAIMQQANYFIGTFDTIVGYVSTAISTVVGIISPITDVVMTILTTIQGLVTSFLDIVFQAFNQKNSDILTSLQGLADAIIPVIQNIATLIEPVITGIANVVAAGINLICGNFEAAGENIKAIFKTNGNSVQDEAVKQTDALAKIAEEGEDDTTSVIENGCLDKYEKLKCTYEEIEAETDEHYDNLKLMAEAYTQDLSANEEAYAKWKSEKLSEWEKKYEETHNTSTLNGLKRMEQERAEEEKMLDEKIAKDRAREEESANNKLKLQKQYIDKSIKLYEDGTEKQTKAVSESVTKQKSLWESLCDSISSLFSGNSKSISVGLSGTKIPGYAVGTNNHPGGIAIVGEQGPELVNMPRGSSVSTNSDTSSIMKDSLSGTECLLSKVLLRLDSLEQTMKESAYTESALVNM